MKESLPDTASISLRCAAEKMLFNKPTPKREHLRYVAIVLSRYRRWCSRAFRIAGMPIVERQTSSRIVPRRLSDRREDLIFQVWVGILKNMHDSGELVKVSRGLAVPDASGAHRQTGETTQTMDERNTDPESTFNNIGSQLRKSLPPAITQPLERGILTIKQGNYSSSQQDDDGVSSLATRKRRMSIN